jgi:hypothetical protein
LRVAAFLFSGRASLYVRRRPMHDSNQRVVSFLEKEIKTYAALSLFLSKKGVRQQLRAGANKDLSSPAFYRDRMREAQKLVCDLMTSD